MQWGTCLAVGAAAVVETACQFSYTCKVLAACMHLQVCNPALQLGTDCIGGQLPNCTPDKNVTASNEDSIAGERCARASCCTSRNWHPLNTCCFVNTAALLAQKAAIVNWPEFSSANNVTGWDALADVCQWTGVTCNDTGSVIMLCVSLPGCRLPAGCFSGCLPWLFAVDPLLC